GQVAAWSPYLSFGRPVWKPHGADGRRAKVPESLQAFCFRLFSRPGTDFPPAFVMDVGVIEERGWAVVEFTPAWWSGLLGAAPRRQGARVLTTGIQTKRQREDDEQCAPRQGHLGTGAVTGFRTADIAKAPAVARALASPASRRLALSCCDPRSGPK